jgi:small subunit ribosomal protein S13
MLRICGVNLDRTKKIKFALLKISGIGLITASNILMNSNINSNLKCLELSPQQVVLIRQSISKHFLVENSLKRKNFLIIKNLISLNCLRGLRHKLKLPVRGQRTRTNARTKRGKKQTVSMKKK